ncbi:MAG: PD-(D/E)XK nuclease family protein, partial [Phycisphaerales bacterium]|nr:PD-(D/E)XK nuclease family protein [Phycisphaerales bacterium]
VFLGTGSHCLHAVVDVLLHRHPPECGTWDLDGVLLLLPSSRAIRRLSDLLLEAAASRDCMLVPPELTSLGRLPEAVVVPECSWPSAIEGQLAWLQTLQSSSGEALAPLMGRGTESDESIEELARRLAKLSSELGGAGLRFLDVAEHESIIGTFEEHRWRAMAALQTSRNALLDSVGCEDRDMAVLRALDASGSIDTSEISMVAFISADLTFQQRGLLERISESGIPVLSLIHADSAQESAFDAEGCVLPEYWLKQSIHMNDDLLHIVDGPEEQAAMLLDLLGSVETVTSFDSVSIGVPDTDLLPVMQRVLPEWDIPVHDPAGRAVSSTSIGRLLSAVEQFLAYGHAADVGPLLRHPIVETWLGTFPDTVSDHVDAWDRFLEESVPLELSTFLPEPHRPIAIAVRPLLQQLQPMRHAVESVADHSEMIRGLLETWVAPSFEELSEIDLRALDSIIEQLAECSRADSAIAGSMSAASMMRMLLSSLDAAMVRTEPDPSSIDLIGWLDCHLDDAPVLLVTGFNEGVVPSSSNADPFLPNELRRSLRMVDNDRRYARDAFLLQAIAESGRETHLVVGRCNANGDHCQPSRLLLTGEGDETVRRVLQLATEPSSAPIVPEESTSVDGFIPCPTPMALTPVQRMSVTSFRSYLACPYRYMLRYVLRLSIRDDRPDELSASVFGTLCHDVLEAFGLQEIDAGRGMTDVGIVKQELDSILDGFIAKRFGRSSLPSVHLQLDTLRSRLHSYAHLHVAEALAGWRILAVEKSFGDGEKADHPAVALPGESRIRLVGKIDRVDVHPEHGYRAIDYKSSDKAKGVVQAHYATRKKQWIDLQLPLYRHLLRSIGIEVEQSQLCYVNLPADPNATKLDAANWGDINIDGADEVALQIIEDVLAERFEPNPDFRSPWDDWARICGTGIMSVDEEFAHGDQA